MGALAMSSLLAAFLAGPGAAFGLDTTGMSARGLRTLAQGAKSAGGGEPQFHIEDSLFRLSPGDVLRLRWWGIGTGDERLVVNPEGNLLIPDMGLVATADRSFREVRDSVLAVVVRRTRSKMVDLQVQSAASAVISVSGRIRGPGVLDVPAGTRLSTIMEQVGWPLAELFEHLGNTSPQEMNKAGYPSVRRVRILRGNRRDTLVVDLAKGYRQGDSREDPRLFSGDQVQLLPPGPVVAVSGGPVPVGYAEYIPGESLAKFLAAVGSEVDPGVRAKGFLSDGSVSDLAASMPLPSGITALQLPASQGASSPGVVWIRGLVRNPGVYPLVAGADARSLLELAGGSVVPGDSVLLIGFKRDWPRLLLDTQSRTSAMSQEGTQYQELRAAIQEHRVRARGSYSSPNPQLQPGDTLDVRLAERVVWVGGQVARPGFVAWKQGASVSDYVEAAGGWGLRPWCGRIRVENLETRQVVSSENIGPGSAILVPERKYLYFDQWITLSATVMSLLLTSYTLYISATQD